MCFRKWFSKPDPVPVPDTNPSNKTALLFAINNYPGSQNDLNGCLNDQRDMAKKLESLGGFYIKKFSDAQVTRDTFIAEVVTAIGLLKTGDFLLIHYSGHGTQVFDIHGDETDGYDEAIYLYDGTVIDDDIGNSLKNIPDGATVLLMFDSCFSGTVTRMLTKHTRKPTKNKFVPLPNHPLLTKKRVRIPKGEMKWIVLSGCGEQQTSADAYISGEYHGAFTYYALKALTPGMTYLEWIDKINTYLPSNYYDQVPTLEGKTELFNKQVFN